MRRPSTRILSRAGSTRRPCSVTISSLTSTRPASIRISALRREATPACARTFGEIPAGESRTLRAQLESAATPPPTVAATPPPAPPKAAPPREGDLVPLGPDVTGPKRVKGDAAQGKRGLTGTVLVEFTVGIDGKPTDIKVVESGGVPLDEAAMKAVRSYRYEPATSHGVKVRVLQRARFTFTR